MIKIKGVLVLAKNVKSWLWYVVILQWRLACVVEFLSPQCNAADAAR